MSERILPPMDRRDFLKLASIAAVASTADPAYAFAGQKVCLVLDREGAAISSAAVKWGVEKLRLALTQKGIEVKEAASLGPETGASQFVVVAASTSSLASSFAQDKAFTAGPESVSLTPGRVNGTPAVLVSATDARGFVYGLLELAERVRYGEDALTSLRLTRAVNEAPANNIRSIARAFCSEVEDKPWYHSKEFWTSYLDVLAASRFNRFNFAFGFGYDFPRGVTDDYFHFPYPYLLSVPGYDVRAVPLEDGERERNLEMLQFIAAETARRGMQFQLGIWTHAYAWTDSPNSTHHIVGLTPETHAAYCRDALTMLLKVCPQIEGVTMRVHGESGIPEGSYPFWRTLFEAFSRSGRRIEIDMHAKGINQEMFDIAAATGMPVKVSPKFWAEHQGLGYHQADIRELEIPKNDGKDDPLFSVSNGARSFTRYGYADLFQQDRKFDVLFRLWPGTQRHLLWGDPAAAAAYGRASHFCGAAGIDICEPLTFKGREGSGQAGGRCAYVDATLDAKDAGWTKFEYTYRLWGRLLYNPETDPAIWRRYLRSDFGPATEQVEVAVANASRVLPLLTTAHLPSASNHSFWPEIYENMPVVVGAMPSPYSDTPTPKCFGTVSPLDPELFSTIVEHAQYLLAGEESAKYSPVEVSQWLDEFTENAEESLIAARRAAGEQAKTPQFRRMEEDVLIQIGLGRFFAHKIRSAILFQLNQQNSDEKTGQLALHEYQLARAAWASMAERAKGVYRADISYGSIPMRRGHWMDRLAHIDVDIAAMQKELRTVPESQGRNPQEAASPGLIINAVITKSSRPAVACSHTPAGSFLPNVALPILIKVPHASIGGTAMTVQLHYRHVNHAERWKAVPMQKEGEVFRAAIAAEYTNSPYPLQYYFELDNNRSRWLYPAFNMTLSNEPYYTIWKRQS
jgi:hypothetical protein